MIRVLIIASDMIGTRMAGPGIRAWEASRALSGWDGGKAFDVTLAVPPHVPRVDMPAALPFAAQLLVADEQTLRAAAAAADVVYTQGFVAELYPWLRDVCRTLALDIYGPLVLEGVAQYSHLPEQRRWELHREILAGLNHQLQVGDFFVCASEKQRDYWLGMLTALDRVNPATYDLDSSLRQLVAVVPFGLPAEPLVHTRRVLKGEWPGIGTHDRVILWLGGIWNWFDPFTLIRAMPQVLAQHPEARLVFLGTRHPNADTPRALSEGARKAEVAAGDLGLLNRQVFFSDWVGYEERMNYLSEADLMAMTYGDHIETRFAYRTRMVDAIYAGLPTVCTHGDTLADLVEQRGLGYTTAAGDDAAVAAALVRLLDEPDAKSARAAVFRELAREMTWERVVAPLAEFFKNPRPSPDRVRQRRLAEAAVAAATPVPAPAATPAAPAPLPAPTPLWELPGRALTLLARRGPAGLAHEVRAYWQWRRQQ